MRGKVEFSKSLEGEEDVNNSGQAALSIQVLSKIRVAITVFENFSPYFLVNLF